MPLDQLTQTMPQQGKKLNKRASRGSKEEILINPKDDDRPIQEAADSTAVMTFGRFNPPTAGHEKLINKVNSVAQEHKGSAHVFASHSEGTAKDPLPQKQKIGYLKKVAPEGTTVSGSSKAEPTFLHAAKKLSDAGHQHLVMVAGSDRVKEYEDRLNKYNGKEGHHNFKSIKVVSSGERDPDAEGVEGMSGTKMRAHARAGESDKFKAGLPKALHPQAKEIMNHINTIKEDVNTYFRSFVEQLTYDKEKNQKQRGVRFSYLAKMNAGNHQTHKGIHDSVSYEQFSKIMDIVEGVEISESDLTALKFKAYRADVPFDILKQVYNRGINEWSSLDYTTQTAQQYGFSRVNSFISGGKAISLDSDLYEALKDACWKGYKAIGMKKKNGKDVPNCVPEETNLDEAETPAWQRKEGKNPEGGLNKKGIASYRSRNPGSKLSTAVTTKPSKLNPDSKAAKRRKSFCARMSGMKSKLTSAKTAKDPDSRINKSLRKWNC